MLILFYISIYMYISKYLKYKNKYLQLGINGRFKLIVKRVNNIEDDCFVVVLWDNQSPYHLRSDNIQNKDFIAWAMFKLYKMHTSLQYPKMLSVSSEQVSEELSEYIESNESVHLKLVERSFNIAMQDKRFIYTLSKNHETNQLLFGDELLTDSCYSIKNEI